MATTFGENEISYMSYRIGKVRVLGFNAAQAIFPRLTMMLGVSLYDVQSEEHAPRDLKRPYVMADISGELRLKEMQDVVAPIFWTGGTKRFVQATPRGHEDQLFVTCDLDFARIEQIERWRAGKPPVFWMQLWPILTAASGERLEWPDIRAFQVQVTREAWLAFYEQVGGGKFDVIEVQFSAREAERFKGAVGQVQKARTQIADADYDGAALTCRKAIEQIFKDLPDELSEGTASEAKDSPLQRFFRNATDADRAAHYVGILSRVKGLANIAAHGIATKSIYGREEAQFILRTTESLLALIGRLASK